MSSIREQLQTARSIQEAGSILMSSLLFDGPHASAVTTAMRLHELETVWLIVHDPMFQDNALRCHCLRKMGLNRYAEAIERNDFTLMLEHEED